MNFNIFIIFVYDYLMVYDDIFNHYFILILILLHQNIYGYVYISHSYEKVIIFDS